jgi:Zn-dependent peptidase ImmA (M78 family)
MEWQAGYVCGAVLMPLSKVNDLAAGYFESEGLYGCAPTGSVHAEHLIEVVANTFGVSHQAARVRLSKLHLIGQSPGPSLFDRIAS